VKTGPDGKPLPPFMQKETKKAEEVDGAMMDRFFDQIQKARSFTGPRMEQIKSAATAMNSLLKAVDEPAFKAMLVDLKVLPSNATVDQGVKPTGVTKSETVETPAGDTKTAELEKRLADTEAKLAEVLKARNPSASVEGEGGGDTKKTVEKSLWSGVL
jgi:hypothetical protein